MLFRMKIGGLASGIDTDSIIRDMMRANRIPLDKILQKKQYMEWQVDSYRAVNRQLNTFSNMIFDNLINPTKSVFKKKTVEVSDNNAVSMKPIGSAKEMSGTLQIHQLAQNATLQGAAIAEKQDPKKTLADLGLGDVLGNGELFIKVPGMEGEPEPIEIRADDTLQNVLNKLNGAGVNAFFDTQTGKIAMTAKNSGKGEIEIWGDAATALGLGEDAKGQPGQNAEFTFNGLRTERASNTFEMNGFEITLKEVTAPDGGEAKTITFTSKADSDAIFDGIKNFVDEYNKLIGDLNGQIREEKFRSFHPLSAEEKAEMTEKEIEQWEEKAKSGTLRNDSTVSNMLSSMRLALSNPQGGDVLASIGITTSKDFLANGKLEIDEEALRKAIQEDPGKVEKMFINPGTDQNDQGFAVRLRSIADGTRKVITDKAGTAGFANETFVLGRSIKDMNNQIDRFQNRLQKTEDRLWRQFSAMEQAINRANAQAAQLMNGLGGM